jgi:hypothetical protein
MGNQKRKADAVRKREQRRRTIIFVVVAVVLVAAVASYFLFIRKTVPPVVASANAAATFAGGTPSLLYADFSKTRELHRMDLESEEDETIGELPRGGNTEAARGSRWLSIQIAEERDDDGAQPVIYIFDPESEQETRVGVGYNPTWSPDGKTLAWSEPEDPTRCRADECGGESSVQLTDPETGTTTELLEAGSYELADWAGDHLIVQDDSDPRRPVLDSLSQEGELTELPIRPIDYWGASPDGRWIVQSGEGDAMFFGFADGDVVGEGIPIGIRDGTKLGAGSWAHDSSRVAAFAAGEDGSLEMITFRPNAPEPVALTDGGQTSTGFVFWAPDNDALLFQRFNGDELEAVYCPLEEECKTVLSWTSGRSLLRLE